MPKLQKNIVWTLLQGTPPKSKFDHLTISLTRLHGHSNFTIICKLFLQSMNTVEVFVEEQVLHMPQCLVHFA